MGYWNSRGLRGSGLEDIINMTNEVYKAKGLAIIQKIPTPITPVKIDKEQGNISLAYFDKQSTVDYIGVVQGIPICFDAKETTQKRLPIQNIHEHQIEFMQNWQKQGGVAFLLVSFKEYDEYYYLPFEVLVKYWNESKGGGRKSIPYQAFDKRYIISEVSGGVVNYLEALNTYLVNKGEN